MRTSSKRESSISEMPQVLLLIETSRAYGRECLLGIASYMRAHGLWDVVHHERGLQEDVPKHVFDMRFDGVIARIENERIANSIAKLDVPTVDLRGSIVPANGVSFDTDPQACAVMAIDHFRDRGFQQLGFCGYEGIDFSGRRQWAFADQCRTHSLAIEVFQSAFKRSKSIGANKSGTLGQEASGEMHEDMLIEWLKSLPKPVGIFACNDVRGRQVLSAVRKAGLRVPDQVAVLGVDDDKVICELAKPPLSSIRPDARRIGFEGAQALAALMSGESIQSQMNLIPPIKVETRSSSDVLSVNDPDLARAIEFIRDCGCSGITVEDILQETVISRATLERRFREVLGRSPREEIERVRLEQVRMLLTETDYSLDQIAFMTSYKSSSHLVTAFRRTLDCTPGQYRKQYQVK